jgi:undecaprenyl-diphosphatase
MTRLASLSARPPVTHLGPELPVTASFPSGHVAAAISLYGAVAILLWHTTRRWLRWLVAAAGGVLLPAFVAASRLYRGVHFPTDVAGSILLAVTWLAVAWWVVRPTRRPAPPVRRAPCATSLPGRSAPLR